MVWAETHTLSQETIKEKQIPVGREPTGEDRKAEAGTRKNLAGSSPVAYKFRGEGGTAGVAIC